MQFVTHVLNGLTLAMLLFLVAGGLTIIFGMLRVINLSHGALYLLGAYIGLATQDRTGNFLLALLAAAVAVAALGLLIDRVFRARLYGDPLHQVLLTLGVAFVIADVVLWLRGGNPTTLNAPDLLAGRVELADGLVMPRYRLALIVFGILLAIVLGVLWTRTRLGALLRAAVEDPTTLEAMGIRVHLLRTGTFVTGAAIAASAGVLGGPYLGVYTGVELDVLLFSVVIVVVGGLGSLPGAFIGSLAVGLIDAFGRAYVPELSYFLLFGPVLLILVFRPEGLFGARAA